MTKKHFIAIARDIHAEVAAADAVTDGRERRLALNCAAIRLCDTFAGFNANFNRRQFMQACGF